MIFLQSAEKILHLSADILFGHLPILCIKECVLYNSLWKPILELQTVKSVTCHVGSHSVTCHLAGECAPPQPQQGRIVLNLFTSEGWKAELTWQ